MNTFVYPAFALLGLIWGSNFIFMKWAAEVISPLQIVLLRVLFGFVPVLVLALSRRASRCITSPLPRAQRCSLPGSQECSAGRFRSSHF
jgi:drug/metabolite transporter (DMT)-like permease